MKKFLIRIALFLLFFISISFFVNSLPFRMDFDGNDVVKVKLDHLKSDSKFNSVFIGSSRTFRQIDPFVFDSLLQSKSIDLNSFNLGAPATFFPECFEILNTVSVEQPHLKYVFLELQPISKIAKSNLFAYKSYYFLDWKHLGFVVNYLKHSEMDFVDRVSFVSGYGISYLYKFFVGRYMSFLNRNSAGLFNLGKRKNGFLSLNETVVQFPETSKEALTNRKEFLADTSVLTKRMKSAKDVYMKKESFENEFLISYFQNLIHDFDNRNIKLYFIIPPRLSKSTYKELHGLLEEEIINSRVLDLGDPAFYPEFYSTRFSFDIGHLNFDGSKIYTRKLAELFLTKIQQVRK